MNLKLLFHILKENKKLNIDNRKLDFKEIYNLLEEETLEVKEAIENYGHCPCYISLIEIVREIYDVIQISILLLWTCNREQKKYGSKTIVQDINIEHKNKIAYREWIIETGIEVDVK